MYDLQFYGLFTMKKCMMRMGEKKTPKNKSNEIKEKIRRLVALPSPRLRKVEAGCFPVSENTENKPDLP